MRRKNNVVYRDEERKVTMLKKDSDGGCATCVVLDPLKTEPESKAVDLEISTSEVLYY
jgi:hypothetical protein